VQKRLPPEKLTVLAVTGWLLCGPGCSRKDPTGLEKTNSPASAQEAANHAMSAFAASLPHVGGPAGYVGSKRCQTCHEDQYGSWHRSYHRTMTQVAAADTVKADFHDVVLTNDSVRFVLSQRRDEFWVHMERPSPGPTGDASAETLDVRIGLVTGSHHMQVFWVPGGEGNSQIGFPFTWLLPEKRWVPRNSAFVRPPEVAHRSEVWNVICSRCHATAVEPLMASATHTVDTRVGELGIACEACHGPGQRHVSARLAENDNSTKLDARTLRGEIVNPKKIEPMRASQICGFCHSMKWWDRTEDWRVRGFLYRPGDDLEATTPIIRPSRLQEIPTLAAYLDRNPELLRDFFWPDGMIRVSGRDYNGLLESPCYKSGKFSCLSCHSLHESEPDGQLARNRSDNRACTQCHERFSEASAATAHTRHLAASSGSECYNCHMPRTTYGVLKAIRSHQVSSPKVADELATGRPNACNLCHLDKPLAWTANQLAQWYGQPIPDLTKGQTEVGDAVQLALAGDAGQRVLIAWHLGWEPALQASGRAWIPPVLSQLLDDPYAAVRCVAERSFKRLEPKLIPAGYDYTAAPNSRAPIQTQVLERWGRETSAEAGQNLPAHTLVQADVRVMQDNFRRLIVQRDDRAVRLRE
jgi:predicted CXXCH cytochrome family protein